MPKVKTIVAHENEIGVRDGLAKYHKGVGTFYDVATDEEAEALIETGVVETHDEDARTGRPAARAGGAAKGDDA